MFHRLFLPAILCIFEELQRQPCDRLLQDPYTAVNRRHLHCGPFGHVLAARTGSQEETIRAAGSPIVRLIPVSENPVQKTHHLSSSQLRNVHRLSLVPTNFSHQPEVSYNHTEQQDIQLFILNAGQAAGRHSLRENSGKPVLNRLQEPLFITLAGQETGRHSLQRKTAGTSLSACGNYLLITIP